MVELVNDLEAASVPVVEPGNDLEAVSVPAVVAANVPVVDSVLAADKR